MRVAIAFQITMDVVITKDHHNIGLLNGQKFRYLQPVTNHAKNYSKSNYPSHSRCHATVPLLSVPRKNLTRIESLLNRFVSTAQL